MRQIIFRLNTIIALITLFIIPVVFFDFFPSSFETPKMAVIYTSILLIGLLTTIQSVILKKIKINYSNNIWPVFLFTLIFIVSGMFNRINVNDSYFLPGTSSYILAGFLLYIFISNLEKKSLHFFSKTISLSFVFVSLITIASFLNIYKKTGFSPLGDIFTTIVLIFSFLPVSIINAIKKKNILDKIYCVFVSFVIVISSSLLAFIAFKEKELLPKTISYAHSWSIAVDTIKQNPMLGIGPGNYIQAFSKYKPLSFNQTPNWENSFTYGGSSFFTMITETGIFGLILYFAIIYLFVKNLIKEQKPESIAGLLIIVFSFFVPFSNLVYIYLFYYLARSTKNSGVKTHLPSILVFAPIVLLIIIISIFATRFFIAEYYLAKTLKSSKVSDAKLAYQYINKAIKQNPNSDRYRIISSAISLNMAKNASKKENLTQEEKDIIASLIQESLAQAKATVALNSQKSSNWENLGNIYKEIISFANGADQFAVQSYMQAIALDPTNPNLRIKLGGIYQYMDKKEEAIKAFELAAIAKNDYPNAHYNLAIAYKQSGQHKKALEQINIVLNLIGKDSADYETAIKELEEIQSLIPAEETIEKSVFEPKVDIGNPEEKIIE